MSNEKEELVRKQVREGYAEIALQNQAKIKKTSCCGSSCGCTNTEALVKSIGYANAELESLPEGANMGLSCGNPTAIASLNEGEVVLDLGSGGGFDVFIAGKKVGASGRVVGVDMTAEMISLARRNIAIYSENSGLSNVEFRLGEIEHLPVADASVDVVISNCVLNLSPNKAQVWREIARVLKPGGRVAISDLALLKPLPAEIKDKVEALVGCIAGAVLVEEMRDLIERAGLSSISLRAKDEYVQTMIRSGDPLFEEIAALLPPSEHVKGFVTSLDIEAVKL